MTVEHALGQRLDTLLRNLVQGDIISLGGTAWIEEGPASDAINNAARQPVDPGPGPWVAMTAAASGWYAVCSQDCDIRRVIRDEPCLLICPVVWLQEEEYNRLRRGHFSPRLFPYPREKVSGAPEGFCPAADARYLTSMDKRALLQPFEDVRPLSAGQRRNFTDWLARRIARPAFSDNVQRDVLDLAADTVRKLSRQFDVAAKAGNQARLPARLVGATDGWYIGGNDRKIDFYLQIDPRAASEAGLFDAKAGVILDVDLNKAATLLADDLRRRLPRGSGYFLSVTPFTPDKVSMKDYVTWSTWIWENPGDPLREIQL